MKKIDEGQKPNSVLRKYVMIVVVPIFWHTSLRYYQSLLVPQKSSTIFFVATSLIHHYGRHAKQFYSSINSTALQEMFNLTSTNTLTTNITRATCTEIHHSSCSYDKFISVCRKIYWKLKAKRLLDTHLHRKIFR